MFRVVNIVWIALWEHQPNFFLFFSISIKVAPCSTLRVKRTYSLSHCNIGKSICSACACIYTFVYAFRINVWSISMMRNTSCFFFFFHFFFSLHAVTEIPMLIYSEYLALNTQLTGRRPYWRLNVIFMISSSQLLCCIFHQKKKWTNLSFSVTLNWLDKPKKKNNYRKIKNINM